MRTDAPRRSAVLALALALWLGGCGRERLEIAINVPADAQVVIEIRDARGEVVDSLYTAGTERVVKWAARHGDGQPFPAGNYSSTIITHRGFAARVAGRIGGDLLPPAQLSGPLQESYGAPSGVVADAQRVYLAWSNGRIAACDLEGHVAWSVALPQLAGCAALAIDGSQLIALARSRPPWLAQDALVRLRAADGRLIPWPRSLRPEPTLPIPNLWPADAVDQPAQAGALAARAGRIYLAFPDLHFLAVLSAESGEYLQTIIGPSPTALDVVGTRTESPSEPGTAIDADFAVVALGRGALGQVLFAHDPLWVIGSDVQRLDQGENVSALTLLGDAAPHHARSFFVGLDAPLYQVQRREILDLQGYVWIAGKPGGRIAPGPWQPEALGPVRAVALDARGRLWVAEGDAVPPRFSVWSTEGKQGRLVREFFGPLDPEDRGLTLLPGAPEIVIGGDCEWRVDTDGAVHCLGVITHGGMRAAAFSEDGHLLFTMDRAGTIRSFQRRGDGDYSEDTTAKPVHDVSNQAVKIHVPGAPEPLAIETSDTDAWRVSTAAGVLLGRAALPPEVKAVSTNFSAVAQSADGRIYGAVFTGEIVRLEITGWENVRVAPGPRLRVCAPH